ncbi:MAG TPA: AlpA family phage regulatory protein [Candidatus Binatia bacterium]|nr:AlpA family phage regulatory protein [Candidatus Binatia bacterium]
MQSAGRAPEEHAATVTLRLIAGPASQRASRSTGSGALLKAASLRRIAGEIALLKAEKGYSQRDRDDDRLLRVDEVLKRVGVKSRVTLWRWVREGRFPKRVRSGRTSSGGPSAKSVDGWRSGRQKARHSG